MEKEKKNILKIVLIIGGVVLVCLLSFFAPTNSKNDNSTNKSNTSSNRDSSTIIANAQKESSSISDDEKKELTEIGISKYLDLYAGSENSLILIARPTCGYCQIAKPIIQNVAYKHNIDINYLNTDELSESEEADLVSSDDYFSSGYGTPILLLVSNKKIVDKVDGLTDSIGYTEFFTRNGFIKE